MDVQDFVKELRNALQGFKSKGDDLVTIDSLFSYLEGVEESLQREESGATAPHENALRLEKFRVFHAVQLESDKASVVAGQGALKASFLLNGGATVALLAFIGILSQEQQSMIPVLADCMIGFVVGTFFAAVAHGATYLSQMFISYMKRWSLRFGLVFNVLVVLLTLASYGSFAYGAYATHVALSDFHGSSGVVSVDPEVSLEGSDME